MTTNNTIRIRLASEDDWQAVYRNQARIYGTSAEPRDIAAWQRRVNLGDILVAEDISDPQQPFLVGTSLYYRLRLTVPGGASLDAAWLAMITVAATHQNRGIWQQISLQGFGILRDRGYPILCGVPTQPPVYEIMGAGVASYTRAYNVDPRAAKLRVRTDTNPTREVTASEAEHLLPAIYDRWRAITHGALTRDSAWWADFLEDRSTQRDGGSPLNFVIHPDGFLTYRVIGTSPHAYRPPFGEIVIQDFCAITDEAHTELLATLAGFEIFDNIAIEVPVDDPLPLKLQDQAAARTTGVGDFLWVRIMNVPEALAARTYSADADIALDITDPLSVSGGQFMLRIRDGVGTCTPHEGQPDIKIGLGDLASIYMGAHRASELRRAQRITELRTGALHNLDAAFCTERAPYCGTLF